MLYMNKFTITTLCDIYNFIAEEKDNTRVMCVKQNDIS